MKISPVFMTNSLGSQKAWEFSRPTEKGKSVLDDIVKIDLPANEFATTHLEIECTIFEREIITSLRNHHIWAQTSRVQNVLDFEIDPTFHSESSNYEWKRDEMLALSKSGIRQDEYRLFLPMASLTKFSLFITARELVKLGLYFKNLSETVLNKLFQKLFNNSYCAIFDACGILGYEAAFETYKRYDILGKSSVVSNRSELVGDYAVISARISASLRAQLVRHREILITDNFLNLFDEDYGHIATLTRKIDVSFAGKRKDIREIASKRQCWLAHYKIWKPIVDEINYTLGETPLPCDTGDCPYHGDAMLRYEDKDPNPPCPIHIKMNDLKISNSQLKEMTKAVEQDERNPTFWIEKQLWEK